MSALTSAGVTDGILTFSVSPPWLMKEESFSIYERESYKDLYNIIFEDPAMQKTHVIIVGNPGIGKSYFALYALSKALQAGNNVIFQCVSHNVVYWFKPGSSVRHSSSLPVLEDRCDALFFYDAATRECGKFPPDFARIIVFSSPARSNYVALEKMDTSVTMYMPVWSAEEMEHAARLLNLDLESVMKDFDVFGGIPRFILPSTSQLLHRGKFLQDLDSAIAQCDLTAIYALGTLDADEHSHKVLHRMLKRKDDGSPNYFTYCVDFASLYVAENIYLTVQQKEQQRLMSFLRGSDGDSHLATLRGTLFEQKAHELLSKGGTFKIRELARTGCQMKETRLRLPVKTVVPFRKLTDTPKNSCDYLKPQSRRFVAVDAISPPDTAFQMTARPRHTIHCDIHKIVNYYNPVKFHLYIVVPESMFDMFQKEQSYVEKYEKVAAHPPRGIEKIKQYVLSIPLKL